MVVAEQKAAGGVGPHRPAGGVDGEIESLGGGEAVGLFGDVPAERLGIPVLDDHKEGDVAVLNGRDHRRVRAPHHAGRVGGDDPMGAIGSTLLSGRVRVPNHPLGSDQMQETAGSSVMTQVERLSSKDFGRKPVVIIRLAALEPD